MSPARSISDASHDLQRLPANVAHAREPNPQHIVLELQRIAICMDRVVATLRARKAVRA